MNVLLALILAATLPAPGTQFKQLPAGKGKAEVEAACYACHSADLLAQQRLNEKQWTATVEKMMRWGATVEPANKDAIVKYLTRHFGPANKFTATRVGVGR
jgi:cytochrome c1